MKLNLPNSNKENKSDNYCEVRKFLSYILHEGSLEDLKTMFLGLDDEKIINYLDEEDVFPDVLIYILLDFDSSREEVLEAIDRNFNKIDSHNLSTIRWLNTSKVDKKEVVKTGRKLINKILSNISIYKEEMSNFEIDGVCDMAENMEDRKNINKIMALAKDNIKIASSLIMNKNLTEKDIDKIFSIVFSKLDKALEILDDINFDKHEFNELKKWANIISSIISTEYIKYFDKYKDKFKSYKALNLSVLKDYEFALNIQDKLTFRLTSILNKYQFPINNKQITMLGNEFYNILALESIIDENDTNSLNAKKLIAIIREVNNMDPNIELKRDEKEYPSVLNTKKKIFLIKKIKEIFFNKENKNKVKLSKKESRILRKRQKDEKNANGIAELEYYHSHEYNMYEKDSSINNSDDDNVAA